MKKKKEMKSRI